MANCCCFKLTLSFLLYSWVNFGICDDSMSKKSSSQPNVVVFLTDDQDTFLYGLDPMVKTKKLIGDMGISMEMHVSSPLCCPSRGSIMSGRYPHNHAITNNTVYGNCNGDVWRNEVEPRSFPVYFKQRGYKTQYAGKYLNQYGQKKAGGVEHIPPGWDSWIGLVGNSRYYHYSLSVNGTAVKHGAEYEHDYFTDVIRNYTLDFLSAQSTSEPFLLMAATPACHAPFTPAPQYAGRFSDQHAPRDRSFNKYGKDKHWLIRQATNPMPNATIDEIDNIFRNRWRTLLSVDDMVSDVMAMLQEKQLLENTYVVFFSDNGYHLGQMSLPNDKRQLYEFDLKVPLMVRGPGIPPGSSSPALVSNIDFAPTLLDLIGAPLPDDMDGLSFLPLLKGGSTSQWRDQILVEHYGEVGGTPPGCHYPPGEVGYCEIGCVCEDARNNTYHCTRTKSALEDSIYCVMQDDVGFVESYNMTSDPWQLTNLAPSLHPRDHEKRRHFLQRLATCKGKSCRQPGSF